MPLDPLRAPPKLLEVAGVAHRLSMSHEQVRRMIRERKIAAIRLESRWRIDEQDLEAYIDAHRIPAAEPAPARRIGDRRDPTPLHQKGATS